MSTHPAFLGGTTGFNGGSLFLIGCLVLLFILWRSSIGSPVAIERRARRRARRDGNQR